MSGTYTSKTTRYQFQDSKGNTHTRQSKAGRIYSHAVVSLWAEGRKEVAYCGRRDLAEKEMAARAKHWPQAQHEIVWIAPVDCNQKAEREVMTKTGLTATTCEPSWGDKPMTLDELRDIANEAGLSHARFCLEQEATQAGHDALKPLFDALDRWEDEELREARRTGSPKGIEAKRAADRVDGYDRDDLGESPDY